MSAGAPVEVRVPAGSGQVVETGTAVIMVTPGVDDEGDLTMTVRVLGLDGRPFDGPGHRLLLRPEAVGHHRRIGRLRAGVAVFEHVAPVTHVLRYTPAGVAATTSVTYQAADDGDLQERWFQCADPNVQVRVRHVDSRSIIDVFVATAGDRVRLTAGDQTFDLALSSIGGELTATCEIDREVGDDLTVELLDR